MRQEGDKSSSYPFAIWSGLLTPEHVQKIGPALWEFLWLVDKTTEEYEDEDGVQWGKVFGGKPIKAEEAGASLGRSRDTTLEMWRRLEFGGYIRRKRTPYGFIIEVRNSKKWLWKRPQERPERESENRQLSESENRRFSDSDTPADDGEGENRRIDDSQNPRIVDSQNRRVVDSGVRESEKVPTLIKTRQGQDNDMEIEERGIPYGIPRTASGGETTEQQRRSPNVIAEAVGILLEVLGLTPKEAGKAKAYSRVGAVRKRLTKAYDEATVDMALLYAAQKAADRLEEGEFDTDLKTGKPRDAQGRLKAALNYLDKVATGWVKEQSKGAAKQPPPPKTGGGFDLLRRYKTPGE